MLESTANPPPPPASVSPAQSSSQGRRKQVAGPYDPLAQDTPMSSSTLYIGDKAKILIRRLGLSYEASSYLVPTLSLTEPPQSFAHHPPLAQNNIRHLLPLPSCWGKGLALSTHQPLGIFYHPFLVLMSLKNKHFQFFPFQ